MCSFSKTKGNIIRKPLEIYILYHALYIFEQVEPSSLISVTFDHL